MTDYAAELFNPKWSKPDERSPDPAPDPTLGNYSAILGGETTRRTPHPPVVGGDSSIGAGLTAGLMTNQKSEIKHFAQKRFPHLPLEQAMARYGIVDGDIVYSDVDEEGKTVLRKEVSGFMPNVAHFVGESGPAIAAGTAGGITGGPAGAAVMAGGGEGWRRWLANMFYGDEQTSGGNAGAIGLTMAGEGLGWKVGQKGVDKLADRRVASDVSRFDPVATATLNQQAASHGVQLTPAESTGLGSLRNQQTMLGMGMDDAGTTMTEFYKRRAMQEEDAIENFIGPNVNADAAGQAARDVGQGAIDTAKNARRAATKPEYDRLIESGNTIDRDTMRALEHDSYISKAFKQTREEGLYVDETVPDNSMKMIDAVQSTMRNNADAAAAAGQHKKALKIREKREHLLKLAEKEYPEYRRLRREYAGMSEEVTALENSMAGTLARIKDPNLASAARKTFSPQDVSSGTVRQTRLMFEKAGAHREWDDLLRAYLRKEWGSVKGTKAGGNIGDAGSWRKKVYGSRDQKRAMKEAMGPERFRAFEDLMDVLEASQSIPKGQSMTQPATQFNDQLERTLAPFVKFGLDSLDLMRGGPVYALGRWWVERKKGDWYTDMAKIITDPRAVDELQRLRVLRQFSPHGRQSIEAVAGILGRSGALSAQDAVSANQQDVLPPMLNQSGQSQ